MLTERGPNADYSGEYGKGKSFPVAAYTPRIGLFEVAEDGWETLAEKGIKPVSKVLVGD